MVATYELSAVSIISFRNGQYKIPKAYPNRCAFGIIYSLFI